MADGPHLDDVYRDEPGPWELWFAWRPVKAYIGRCQNCALYGIPHGETEAQWLRKVYRRRQPSGQWEYNDVVFHVKGALKDGG